MKIAALFLASLAASAAASPIDLTLVDGTRVHIEDAACGRTSVCNAGSARLLGGKGRATRYVSSITVATGSRSYALDVSDMVDPLFGTARTNFSGFCYDDRNCGFRAVFGDAGGSYAAEWQVIEGKPVRTVFSGSGDLVQFFLANPVPPRYE
ncbi:hypothetical protein AB4Z32_18220 [Massilia sp. 2TAF26]|uniref:hypothetical protein n=1 Tax=Massilia sp. 2TAF26 TaxID=3233012 RepID=UPI003F946127